MMYTLLEIATGDTAKFQRLHWDKAAIDQVVYIDGRLSGGIPTVAYGPHTVVDPQERKLRNERGHVFLHYPPLLEKLP